MLNINPLIDLVPWHLENSKLDQDQLQQLVNYLAENGKLYLGPTILKTRQHTAPLNCRFLVYINGQITFLKFEVHQSLGDKFYLYYLTGASAGPYS